VLRDGCEALVLNLRCEAVGDEDVDVVFAEFYLIVRYPVVFHAEHVRDQVEDRVLQLELFVPESVGRRHLRGVVAKDLIG